DMSFKEEFFKQIDQFTSAPILFLGSGFSLRYLNTENWENLLRLFSDKLEVPFEKYRSKANGSWPKVGSLLAEDFHGYWFSTEDLRDTAKHEMITEASPLKVAISNHFIAASEREIDPKFTREIELLK